jgi:hypothetical protein
LGELAKQLGIGGEHFVGNAFEFIAHFACRHELTNVINDFPLFFARKLFDFLDDFNGTHGIKLTAIPRASKPAHGNDHFVGFMIYDFRFTIWFGNGHKINGSARVSRADFGVSPKSLCFSNKFFGAINIVI